MLALEMMFEYLLKKHYTRRRERCEAILSFTRINTLGDCVGAMRLATAACQA
jgi:hypothetical protein